MIGKTIKINDINLLKFFYPEFYIREELHYADRDLKVIYNGPMRRNLKEYLESNTRSYISLAGPSEIDLTNKEVLLDWVYGKADKKVPNSIREAVQNYDDEYLTYCCKVFWVTGRWVGYRDGEITLYNLFMATIGPFKDSYLVYNRLLETIPAPVIESSFLTFLSRVKNISDQNVSPGYMKLLKQSDARYGRLVKQAVYKMAMRDDLRDELAFFDLITDLR